MKIIAKNKLHLIELIQHETALHGFSCNLNHIDTSLITNIGALFTVDNKLSEFNGDISQWNTSNITNMSRTFYDSKFNGDISLWDVSQVMYFSRTFYLSDFQQDLSLWNTSSALTMKWMFADSKFNGDISLWNVSNVRDMGYMFTDSEFNGDISKWNISKVEDMEGLFRSSSFQQDLSDWKPYYADIKDAFLYSKVTVLPYWHNYDKIIERGVAIDKYNIMKKLTHNLQDVTADIKKNKI
jgi:surface protein